MNELSRNEALKRNYYALFIAIAKGKTAKESLLAMGICPDNDMEGGKENAWIMETKIIRINQYMHRYCIFIHRKRGNCCVVFNLVRIVIHFTKGGMDLVKGYTVPDGFMGFVEGKYQLFETECAYYEYMLERKEY